MTADSVRQGDLVSYQGTRGDARVGTVLCPETDSLGWPTGRFVVRDRETKHNTVVPSESMRREAREMTCRQLGEAVQQTVQDDTTPHLAAMRRTQAQVLGLFGDMPVPDAVLEAFKQVIR